MCKFILFCLSIFMLTTQLEAHWFSCFQGIPFCYRFMDVTVADYDYAPYGYVDNINYNEPYYLPLNYYFRRRCPCRNDRANYNRLMECIHYTNARNCCN